VPERTHQIAQAESAAQIVSTGCGHFTDLKVILPPRAQGLADAVEHRNGAQRVPLLTGGIGSAACVSDLTAEEVTAACEELWAMHA
jgi:hypothetical protein